MMRMRIFEESRRAGAYVIMAWLVGPACFGQCFTSDLF